MGGGLAKAVPSGEENCYCDFSDWFDINSTIKLSAAAVVIIT